MRESLLHAKLAGDDREGALIALAALLTSGGALQGQRLGHMDELLGTWLVKYPGPDGMIENHRVETLVLHSKGTYTWSPSPAWARSGGKWGVTEDTHHELRLCFEDNRGQLRCNYLVLLQLERDGPLSMNWQRTSGGSVIFSDRIFRADRREGWPESGAAPVSRVLGMRVETKMSPDSVARTAVSNFGGENLVVLVRQTKYGFVVIEARVNARTWRSNSEVVGGFGRIQEYLRGDPIFRVVAYPDVEGGVRFYYFWHTLPFDEGYLVGGASPK